MIIIKNITIYCLATLYIVIGIKHFTETEFFIQIIPSYLNYKKELVLISGVIEIILGFLLFFKFTRKIASWGIILLLLAVFPANIYLYISDFTRESLSISKTQALVRMPFQIPLIVLAYWHSQAKSSKKFSIICCILFFPTIFYFISI
tara:strand:- start:348 stop:791 length:444 start_codon:yes stop_codon:yes gene_type:complete